MCYFKVWLNEMKHKDSLREDNITGYSFYKQQQIKDEVEVLHFILKFSNPFRV